MGKKSAANSSGGAKHRGMEAKSHFVSKPSDSHPPLKVVDETPATRYTGGSSSSNNQPKPRTLRRKQERYERGANTRTTDLERRLAAKERAAAARGVGAAGALNEALGDQSTKYMVGFLLLVVVGSALLQIF